MDDIETAKNLTVKARTAYSVWDVCRLFIEMIAPDVDIDIESKRKSDELLFPGYVIRPMESLTTGRPYGLAFVSLLLVRLEGTSSFVLAWFTSVLPSNSLFFCCKRFSAASSLKLLNISFRDSGMNKSPIKAA